MSGRGSGSGATPTRTKTDPEWRASMPGVRSTLLGGTALSGSIDKSASELTALLGLDMSPTTETETLSTIDEAIFAGLRFRKTPGMSEDLLFANTTSTSNLPESPAPAPRALSPPCLEAVLQDTAAAPSGQLGHSPFDAVYHFPEPPPQHSGPKSSSR